MMRLVSLTVVLVLIALTNIGGCNIFSEVADKQSDQAIIDDINKLIDGGFWNDAVQKWNLLSPKGKTQRPAIVLLATAYAGRGGLDLLNLISSLNNNSGATAPKTLFQELLTAFRGSTILKFRDEILAEETMQSVGATAAQRTSDENIFMVFVEFAKIGTLLAAVADPANTGAVAANFDNCNFGDLSAYHASHLMTGIANIVDSITATGSAIAQSSLSALTAACAGLAGACNVYTIPQVTPAMIQIARTLAGESLLGIGLAAPLTHPGGGLDCEIAAVDVCQGNAGVPPCLCP